MGCERRVVYDFINVINGEATLNQALIKDKQCDNLFVLAASQTRDKDALTAEGVRKVLDELIADGWNAVAKIDQNFQVVPCETCGIVHPFDFEFFPDDDPSQFRTVMKVVNAGRRVIGAPIGGWYVQASMTHDSTDPDDPEQMPVAYLDLVEMIGLEYLHYAVWPVNSPFAKLACKLNLHEIHAGECSEIP
jgi:hypothetical protein